MGVSVFLLLSALFPSSDEVLVSDFVSSPLPTLPSVVDFLVESELGDGLLGSGVG